MIKRSGYLEKIGMFNAFDVVSRPFFFEKKNPILQKVYGNVLEIVHHNP
jgi:hypothetical protein